MNEKMVDVLIHYSNQTCCKCLSSVILVSVIEHGHGSEILTNLGPQKYLQVAFLAKKMCFPHQHISNTILLAIQIKYQMFENCSEQFGGCLEFTLRWQECPCVRQRRNPPISKRYRDAGSQVAITRHHHIFHFDIEATQYDNIVCCLRTRRKKLRTNQPTMHAVPSTNTTHAVPLSPLTVG